MKKRPYKLNLQTPLGECEAAADTMPALVEITPRGLFGGLIKRGSCQEGKLDIVARDLWASFLECCKADRKAQHTKLSRSNCELDLMKCYLQDMTIEETVEWLEINREVSSSSSAIGRYWSVLRQIGPEFKARL